jgi:hypothetical protein
VATERRVDLEEIQFHISLQLRDRIDQDTVAEYAEDMRAGDEFPPIVLFFDGDKYWLADGMHRVAAARSLRWKDILADVRDGSYRDACLYAATKANRSHGLRLTNADKRKRVLALLNDEEWRTWSDSEIGRQCGVSHPFVGKIRQELSCNGYKIDERTVQRGGTVYTMNTANIAAAGQQEPAAGPAPGDEPVAAGPGPDDWLAPYRAMQQSYPSFLIAAKFGANRLFLEECAQRAASKLGVRPSEVKIDGRRLVALKLNLTTDARAWRKLEEAFPYRITVTQLPDMQIVKQICDRTVGTTSVEVDYGTQSLPPAPAVFDEPDDGEPERPMFRMPVPTASPPVMQEPEEIDEIDLLIASLEAVDEWGFELAALFNDVLAQCAEDSQTYRIAKSMRDSIHEHFAELAPLAYRHLDKIGQSTEAEHAD